MSSLRKHGILCILFALALQAGAQSVNIDSINRALQTAKGEPRLKLLLAKTEALIDQDPRNAVDAATEALKEAQEEKSTSGEADATVLTGRVSAALGNHGSAMQSYSSAELIYKTLNDQAKLGETDMYMSASLNAQGDYQEALAKAMAANRVFTQLNDQVGSGRSLINVGLAYYNIKNYNEAIANYRSALTILSSTHQLAHVAKCYNNLGNVFKAQKQLDTALSYLEKSLTIKRQLGNKNAIANSLNTIGAVYEDKQEYEKSASYYLEALDIRKELGDEKGMSELLTNLGSLKQHQGDDAKAIEYYRRANELARKVAANDVLLIICLNQAELYYDKGDYKSSAEQYATADSLNSIIYKDGLTENTARMQAQFNVDKAMQNAELERQKREDANRTTIYIIIAATIVLLIISTLAFVLYRQSKIRRRINISLKQQKKEIEQKNSALQQAYVEIEEKNKDITDSIRYAKRIQEAVLPSQQQVAKLLDNVFILFRPKDIVSGDFYWVELWGGQILVAAADCTGHGVPGALMSVMGQNLLSQSVNVYGLAKPNLVLNSVNKALSATLRQRKDEASVRDGMDIALIAIDQKAMLLEFSGANNSLWLLRKGEIIEIKGDKQPIGNFVEDEPKPFSLHELQLQKDDQLYLFSDGYADQFGGPKGKKLKRSGLRELLLSIKHLPMPQQKEMLEEAFDVWRGRNEQVDDVLVIGIQI